MKRFLIVVGLCALSVSAWGFNLSQITYLRAVLPNSGPVVQIPSMKEFIQLVEATKAPFIYRVVATTERQSFAFVSGGAVYLVDTYGFRNLVEAEKATELGLSSNAELQVAERFGIKNLHSIVYANSEYFGSETEYRSAMSGGFRGSSAGLRALLLPERMSAKEFSEILLPQIAWYFLSLDATQPARFRVSQASSQSATAVGTALFVELAGVFENAGVKPDRNWSWMDYHAAIAKLDASPAFTRWATEVLAMYSINDAGDLVAATSNPRDLDLMKAMAPLGIRPSNTTTPSPGLVPPAPHVARSMQILPRFPTDSLVYAAARLFGITSATEYLSLNQASAAGYRSVSDEHAAVRGGFSRPRQYYNARRLGVVNFSDYETVWSAGIRTPGVASRYLALIADLRSLKSECETTGPNQLAVAYVLNRLPASEPFTVMDILRKLRSIEKSFLLPAPHSMDLFSRATHMVAGALRPLGGGMQATDLSEYSEIPIDSGVRELALELRNAPWTSSFGSYDPATSTFVRS